ncbi:GtrA family protein [Halococcus sediminicola]|uniref:GtrA family protein n=1 Tax=Halococcus sediminicola TaxID=1264579 RepID=UPI000678F77E|nr:GtrA family protein [Halococcus sediminicola]
MSTRTLLDGLYARFAAITSTVRFGQFVSIGVLGAICENVVLLGLVEGVGVTPELAKLVGAEASIVVMFAANERWTFADAGRTGVRWLIRRFLTSNLVRAGGVLVGTVVFSALLRWVDVSLSVAGIELWLLAANVIGIAVGLVVNYVAESLFTWRVHTKADGG